MTFRTVCVTVGAVAASLCGAALFVSASTSIDQLGADIDGEAAGDRSGYSVSLSSDGTIIAIGAHQNDDSARNAGHVRIYEWNGSTWQQKGADIDGVFLGDRAEEVSLSSDGTIVAIGAGRHSSTGHVRVYAYDGVTGDVDGVDGWTQMGADIDGEDSSLFGSSVSLSSDGTIIAIGGSRYDPYYSIIYNTGYVQVYEWDGTAWTQKGADMVGEASDDRSGCSVSLSSDGTIVAIGAFQNDGNGADSGHVRVYAYDGVNGDVDGVDGWTQMGADIDGEAVGDEAGWSVALSADGTILAIGARLNDGNGNDAGHVRVCSITTSSPTTSTPAASAGPRVPGQVPPWPVAIPNVDGTVTVSWQAPFDDGNGPITGYRVTSSPTGGSCSTTGLTCVIAGLDPNVDYLFEVFASNSDGEGPGRLTQQSIRIVPQTPATTEPAAPQLLPVTPAAPQPLPETGTDDDLVMWSMLLAAFGTLITLATRQRQAPT